MDQPQPAERSRNRLFGSQTSRYALYGAGFGAIFPAFATAYKIVAAHTTVSASSIATVQATDPLLWLIDTAPFFLGLFAALAGRRQDALIQVNDQLQRREKEIELSRLNLEKLVAERTDELTKSNEKSNRRVEQLQTVAEVSRAVTAHKDLRKLLEQIAHLISQHFGYYHVGVFLLDDSGEYALLQAANSEGGRRMLARGHQLRVEANSIVGFAALFRRPRIALDTGADIVHFKNADLPDTRSEMAVPLIIGERTIGILDVQSMEPSAFSEEDSQVIGTLANQMALAIENTRLFEETSLALEEAQESYQKFAGGRWSNPSARNTTAGYRYDGARAVRLSSPLRHAEIASTLASGEVTRSAENKLVLPIKIRNRTIGVLNIRPKDSAHHWSDDEISVAQAAAERAGLALEGARLLEDAQRRAAKERTIGELSAKIGATTNIDTIMRSAVQELGRTLGRTEVILQLGSEHEG